MPKVAGFLRFISLQVCFNTLHSIKLFKVLVLFTCFTMSNLCLSRSLQQDDTPQSPSDYVPTRIIAALPRILDESGRNDARVTTSERDLLDKLGEHTGVADSEFTYQLLHTFTPATPATPSDSLHISKLPPYYDLDLPLDPGGVAVHVTVTPGALLEAGTLLWGAEDTM